MDNVVIHEHEPEDVPSEQRSEAAKRDISHEKELFCNMCKHFYKDSVEEVKRESAPVTEGGSQPPNVMQLGYYSPTE